MNGPPHKPREPSESAQFAPTDRSLSVETLLDKLRLEIVSERSRRRAVVARTMVLVAAAAVIAVELTILSFGVVDVRRSATTIVFAVSCGLALIGMSLALHRILLSPPERGPIDSVCAWSIAGASLAGVVGAFIALWPA